MLRQLRHMYDAGAWVLLESAIADLPADLRWLFESGAVTLEQLSAIHHTLGTTSATDLRAEVKRQGIRGVPDLDEQVEAAIGSVLPTLRAALPRIPLGRAVAIVEPVLDRLTQTSGIEWAQPVGSLRRGQDTIGDIEVVASAVDPSPAFEEVQRLPEVSRILYRGSRRLYLRMDSVQVGVRCPHPDSAGAMLLHLTGSAAHLES